MPNTQSFLQNLRDQIAQNQIAEALQSLRALLDNSPLLDEAILQAARFQDIRQQIRLGVVSHADATLTQNQIRAGLLDLLREIESHVIKCNFQSICCCGIDSILKNTFVPTKALV